MKAKILFGLRKFGYESEAEEFAREWETARMLQLVPTDRADRALLDTDVLDDNAEKILTAVPYDPEMVRVQFSRYLLLVKAFMEGKKAPTVKEYQEIAYKGAFGKEFKTLCEEGDGDAFRTFAEALRTVNDLFLANRDFCLLARRNRVEVKEEDGAEKRPPLTASQNRLLLFQGYVSGGTASPNWLAHEMLMRILRELPQGRKAEDTELDGMLEKLETDLFVNLNNEKAGEHVVLTARDWFLWRALFDDVGNPVYETAVKGCDEMLKTAAERFNADTGEALWRTLRDNAGLYVPTGFPTATGAAEVEHWVPLDRGKKIDDDVKVWLEKLSNKAHIANGINQSMRNDGILKKVASRVHSWWPTLQFLAAYSACGKGWTVAENSPDETNLEEFIKPLDDFWKTVANKYKKEKEVPEEGR